MQAPRLIPYPPLASLGVIGDRRTAALVAADGTLSWLCLPDFDGAIVCGALLDTEKGGFWQLGPVARRMGKQSYLEDTALLVTTWELDDGLLELTDFMPGPANDRSEPPPDQRVIARRLRCGAGQVQCCLHFEPAYSFEPVPLQIESPTLAHVPAHASLLGKVVATIGQAFNEPSGAQALPLWLWVSKPILTGGSGIGFFELKQGEELWAILTTQRPPTDWSSARAQTALSQTEDYWKRWVRRLNYSGPRARQVRLYALLAHLLSYAPTGSVIAAPTTSLPERIGGDWNADYRLSWVRDTSIALELLSRLGITSDAQQYLQWLSKLHSSTTAPIQVVYGVHGELELKQHERQNLYGYRGSKPVRLGNHATHQSQLDSLGFLLDGIHIYLHAGGEWQPDFWDLVQRVANYLVQSWDQPDNSIWELAERRQYVSGKVMCAIGLDRAASIAGKLGQRDESERWSSARDRIRAEVLSRGWSEQLHAFRQHYDSDNLDAATLLVTIHDFLPAGDPRVVATVEQIANHLSLKDFVYRFDPRKTPGTSSVPLPMVEFEGAFFPCTFWMAIAYAKQGRKDRAEAILRSAEACLGSNMLFAEGVDARSGQMRGNSPLLFSHSEYIRAILALAEAPNPGRG